MADKYYHVVQKYIKKRILIQMKYSNHHIASLNKKKELNLSYNDIKNLKDLWFNILFLFYNYYFKLFSIDFYTN